MVNRILITGGASFVDSNMALGFKHDRPLVTGIVLYGLRAIVNHCGVISGPRQIGKIDQGFLVV